MLPITDTRQRLAELLQEGLNLDQGLARTPSPILASTVFIVPQAGVDYVDWSDGTYSKPTYALSAIVVGPTTNVGEAYDWIDEKITEVKPAIDTDPTLGGRISGIALRAVGEPGLMVAQGGALLSVELQFIRFYLSSNFYS